MIQGPQGKTSQQLKNEREVRKYLDELGNSVAVARLIDRYGKVSTRRVYLVSLVLYFRWLKNLGVVLSPDELVTDNLTCVFHSDPADVGTKRKHTDWLSRYVNQARAPKPRPALSRISPDIRGLLMVVNRSKLTANLTEFYDFKGKSVLYVGAGGGQLLGPASGVSKVVAVDSNAESLEGFRSEEKTKWAGIPIRFVPYNFETVNLKGDVVYFEFCLHEMPNPRKALDHAHSLAPDIVVIDHLPKSKWIFYGAEETQVLRSTKAAESFGIRRRERFTAQQKFKDCEELEARMSEQGEVSRRRMLALKGAKDIRIRMDYGLYLL